MLATLAGVLMVLAAALPPHLPILDVPTFVIGIVFLALGAWQLSERPNDRT